MPNSRALRTMPAMSMKAWLTSGVPSPLPLTLERECGLVTDSGWVMCFHWGATTGPRRA